MMGIIAMSCNDSLRTLGREYLVEDILGPLHDRGIAV